MLARLCNVLGGSRSVPGWIVRRAEGGARRGGAWGVVGAMVVRAWLGRAGWSLDAVLPCASHLVPRLECSLSFAVFFECGNRETDGSFWRADPASCRESGASKYGWSLRCAGIVPVQSVLGGSRRVPGWNLRRAAR